MVTILVSAAFKGEALIRENTVSKNLLPLSISQVSRFTIPQPIRKTGEEGITNHRGSLIEAK